MLPISFKIFLYEEAIKKIEEIKTPEIQREYTPLNVMSMVTMDHFVMELHRLSDLLSTTLPTLFPEIPNVHYLTSEERCIGYFKKALYTLKSHKLHSVSYDEMRNPIHSLMCEKGFWGDDTTIVTKSMLIVTELSEAVEAVRSSRRTLIDRDHPVNLTKYEYTIAGEPSTDNPIFRRWFLHEFSEHVKDTLEDEIADAIIRCLDIAGNYGISLGYFVTAERESQDDNKVVHVLWEATRFITLLVPLQLKLRLVIGKLHEISSVNPILKHIIAKMKYNEFREYQHGKRF